jgi:hypothetical protein
MESRKTVLLRSLTDYLAETISLDELKDFVVAATWQLPETESPDSKQLAYDIELALAEESSGYLTRDELREELRGPVNQYATEAQV